MFTRRLETVPGTKWKNRRDFAVRQRLQFALNDSMAFKEQSSDHGATQGETYTWKDAQEAVQLLLKGNVLLVGHALHNDLKALHLDPTAFIDTALLLLYK